MTEVQPDEDSTASCPVCGHPENVHAHWRADAICDGWAHCTVGSEATRDACQCWRSWPKLAQPTNTAYEVEFRWKEEVIYWEGSRGVVFPGGWGVEPPVTIVPDSVTWDRRAPDWLRGRHDEVVARLRAEPGHVVHEERDDSITVQPLAEILR